MLALIETSLNSAHRRINLVHSAALLGAMGAIVAVATSLIWGPSGALIAVAAIVAAIALSPRVPPVAIMRLYRATPIPRDASQLSSLLDVLAWRAELPARPMLYVIPSLTLNAFAVGSGHDTAIALTEGLLRRLSLREVGGVLAHEISHIKNKDLWVMGLADLITRFLQAISYVGMGLAAFNVVALFTNDEQVSWIAVLILYLAPSLSSLLQLALSRTREFDADAEAAALTGDPAALASALGRLESYTGHFWEDLMLPVPARRVPMPSLLRTHPETAERIERLHALSALPRYAPIEITEQPMVSSLAGYGPGDMRPRYRWPGLWY